MSQPNIRPSMPDTLQLKGDVVYARELAKTAAT